MRSYKELNRSSLQAAVEALHRPFYFLGCNCSWCNCNARAICFVREQVSLCRTLVRMTSLVLKQYRMTRDACSHGKIWFICKLLPLANLELARISFERLAAPIFHLHMLASQTLDCLDFCSLISRNSLYSARGTSRFIRKAFLSVNTGSVIR